MFCLTDILTPICVPGHVMHVMPIQEVCQSDYGYAMTRPLKTHTQINTRTRSRTKEEAASEQNIKKNEIKANLASKIKEANKM